MALEVKYEPGVPRSPGDMFGAGLVSTPPNYVDHLVGWAFVRP